jgi:hypothetical protein
MIAGGPGFKSRLSPAFNCANTVQPKLILYEYYYIITLQQLNGPGVWFLLRMLEVPGSNPAWAQLLTVHTPFNLSTFYMNIHRLNGLGVWFLWVQGSNPVWALLLIVHTPFNNSTFCLNINTFHQRLNGLWVWFLLWVPFEPCFNLCKHHST